MDSPKYNRTFHLPWSPGGTSDDKIAASVESLLNRPLVITEKMDGSNTSLETDGCFARTHSGPPNHPSFDALKALHAIIKYSIPEGIQVFGEWCFALHSISYDTLPSYFLAFGIRDLGSSTPYWFSWSDLEAWTKDMGLTTVPLLWSGSVASEEELQAITESLVKEPSAHGATREGVVVRVASDFNDTDFSKSVMKWVRKDHVQTSEHWKDQEIIRNKLKI
jgi:hypothetical protein